MNPEYWVHTLQSTAIEQYHTMRVIAQDASFGVDIMFVEIDERRLWARVEIVHHLPVTRKSEEGTVSVKHSDGWEVGWGGPVHKWRILSPNGALHSKEYSTKADAEAELARVRPPRAA